MFDSEAANRGSIRKRFFSQSAPPPPPLHRHEKLKAEDLMVAQKRKLFWVGINPLPPYFF